MPLSVPAVLRTGASRVLQWMVKCASAGQVISWPVTLLQQRHSGWPPRSARCVNPLACGDFGSLSIVPY